MRIQYNINNNYNQNVQVRQRNLNNSNLESKKLENRTQKYSTNENISFGMGTIKPQKGNNVLAEIISRIVKIGQQEANANSIEKTDNIVNEVVKKVTDNSSNFKNEIKKVDSVIENQNLKMSSDNNAPIANIIENNTEVNEIIMPNYSEEYNFFKNLADKAPYKGDWYAENGMIKAYYHDSGALMQVSERDPQNPKWLNLAFFDKNGKLESGERTYPEIIKRYSFYGNGRLKQAGEYNPTTNKCVQFNSFYEDGTLESIINFDPITKKKLKQTCYLPEGKGIGCIVEYDPITENELKEIVYHSDGKNIKKITDYDTKNFGCTKNEKYYQADGKTLERIIDYNTSEELVIGKVEKMEVFSRVLKDTYYHADGKNIKRLIVYPDFDSSEFDKIQTDYQIINGTNRKIKKMFFCDEALEQTIEYDPTTGHVVKDIEYYEEEIERISEYWPATGNKLKETVYPRGGKAYSFIIDYDSNGNMLKETYYHADGQTIKTIATPDYDQNGNKIIKEIEYCKDGKTIKWILEKEPETEKVLKQTNYESDGKTIKEVIEYS